MKVIWQKNGTYKRVYPAGTYKSSKPLGQSGLVINGIPEKAGSNLFTITGTNKWGQASEVFNICITSIGPKLLSNQLGQLLLTTGNIFDLGGADSNLSFIWGTHL